MERYVIDQRFTQQLEKYEAEALRLRLKNEFSGMNVSSVKPVSAEDDALALVRNIDPAGMAKEINAEFESASKTKDYERVLVLLNNKQVAHTVGRFFDMGNKYIEKAIGGLKAMRWLTPCVPTCRPYRTQTGRPQPWPETPPPPYNRPARTSTLSRRKAPMADPKPTNEDNLKLLDSLIDGWENEVVEFKEAGRDYDTDRIGRYVCALCNEANLGGADAGWLVFGVRNKTRSVVGTDYRSDPARLNGIKAQVADGTEPSLTFRSIRVVDHPEGRVVLFEVPPAP